MFYNATMLHLEAFAEAQIKGVHVFNPGYHDWRYDHSQFHSFTYCGITQDSTIDDVLAILGMPYDLAPASGTQWCFVWLHYQSASGDTLHIKADPATNQLIELRLEMYVSGITEY